MHTLTIPPLDQQAAHTTQTLLNNLAKVPHSLGRLEDLAVSLAGMTGHERPLFPHKTVVLFAGDHDIALNGLSATGQDVTERQVKNFLQGGGTINAFTRNAGAALRVVDVGMKTELPHEPAWAGLIRRNVMRAARDFSREPAMTREQAIACLQLGIDLAREEAAQGTTLLAAGEMGIGNTSPSSAIAAVMTRTDIDTVTDAGSGINAAAVAKKKVLLRQALNLHRPDPNDPVEVLRLVGGAELGAMAGLMLGGASLRIPVVVDGFIAGAAAALAVGIQPNVRHYLIGSHMSVESGHKILMDHLGVRPFFDFDLRLGEGTGAALLFPIIDASVRILHEMRTLHDIGL